MSVAELNALHIIHVVAVVALLAYTFYAFAAAPDSRKRVMIITGVATLLVLLTGIRMWQGMYSFGMLTWVWVKVVAWVALSALAGIGYRKREKSGAFMTLILVLATIAVTMVYVKVP